MAQTQQSYITPIETVPTSGEEADTYQLILQSLPDPVLDVMADMKTADFINRIRAEYRLDDSQRTRLATFLRDALIGVPFQDDLAGALASYVSIDKKDALQILRTLERDILFLAGLSLKDIGRTTSGPEIREEAGRLLLRYRSLNDLLAAVENLSNTERIKFLHDAASDNRILVIKALTHLKLGVDSKGRPLSFRDLVKRDAPDFSGRDWVDVLREDRTVLELPEVSQALVTYLTDEERIAQLFIDVTDVRNAELFHRVLEDAMLRSKPSVVEYVKWSPYFAGLFDKKTGINTELFERFMIFSETTRSQIISRSLPERIAKLIKEGTVPENYGVAVAKIVFFVAIGHIQPESMGILLGEKLGLGTERGRQIAGRITDELLSRISFSEPVAPQPEQAVEESSIQDTVANQSERSAKTPENDKLGNMKNVVDLRKTRSEG